MKRPLILFFVFVSFCLFCEETNAGSRLLKHYQDFLDLNASYTTVEETILTKQNIVKYSGGVDKKSSEYVYCLFHKNGQCVQMKTKKKVQYFFSSQKGYWLYTSKLKSPLKISGAYKVEEFEVQDILKIDFQNEYKVLDSKDDVVTLERQNQKSSYKFIFFEKKGDGIYSLTFTDNKRTPVRKLVYHHGVVDGFPCFMQIDIYNLLFNKNEYTSWITESIKKTNVPSSLFVHSKIKQLAEQMASILRVSF